MSSIELTEVRALPTPATLIRAFALETPASGDVSPAAGFALSGWVLGQPAPIVALTVTEAGQAVTELPVDGHRNDILATHPTAPNAQQSGFQGWVSTVNLGPGFQVEVHARTAAGEHAVLATISGQQRRSAGIAGAERPASGSHHRFPQFFIIGAQRGGTRSLYQYLAAHPEVRPARTDEVHFFSLYFDRGVPWFLNQFPPPTPGTITGEASPYYLFHPLAPQRLRAIVPEARLIVLLRDPVERAFSHYQLEVERGYEPLSFEDALAAEEERLAGEEERLLADDTFRGFPYQHYSYQARGRYVEQLRRWLDLFPAEQVMVAKSEGLFADPAAVYAQTTDFLGLRRVPLTAPRVYNRSRTDTMREETRDALRTAFGRQHPALTRLIGDDFIWEE